MLCPRENRCRRFQANIFNKRKCQNCFRTVESHTLSESDLHATKPVKAGWLLLAPEDIDFQNVSHKNRKWQRRYFILHENGLLRYSLDEMPGTLPQGSVTMSQCSDVHDASAQTRFCNSLRMCFSDRDYYIRTENAENIAGWQENLLVYLSTAKANLRKRRREQTLPLYNLKKHAVSERNQVSDGSNRNYILNTGCSSLSRSSTKKGGPENSKTTTSNYSLSSMDIKQNGNIGDVHTRIGAEGFSVGQCGSKDTSGSGLEGVEVGPPLSSSPGAGLQEEPEELDGNAEVQSSSRMSHTNSLHTSSITSDLFSLLSQVPAHISTNAAKSREGIESGYCSLEKTRSDAEDTQTGPESYYRRGRGETRRTHSPGREEVYRLFGKHRRRPQVISQFEQENGMPTTSSTCSAAECDQNDRASHSTTRALARGQGAAGVGVSASTCQRSKSLERNLAEHTSTPDLLNFKKGWMTRLGEDGKWRKHWFVLTNQSLRFYRDSVAEEAADLDGEINLSTCYDITDFPVQRNYGFQIHTKDGVFTLCAMTSGIRRNWIEAVKKNVQTSVAPDVTCSVPSKVPMGMDLECKYPFVSNSCTEEKERRSSVAERRKEGRYKTFDWSEFSHMRNTRETLSRQSGIESEYAFGDYIPPAPASTPEEPLPSSSTVVLTDDAWSITRSTDTSPLMVRSSIVTSEPSNQKNAEVDWVNVRNDISNAQIKEKKETDLYMQTSPATFPSVSVQTEWQWELELQTLHNELKAVNERSDRESREFKHSEACFHAELNGSLDSLRKTELKLEKTEATLKERENELDELRNCLEEVSGRLKATEEAQALKDVRLQRHLCLLEESQERERRSLSDSLEHAEKRGKDLEERLMQTEAKLQKMPTGGIVEQLERKCQELRNQLDESDSELSKLQARLEHEETLYYDIEHNYEQVCEELEFVRGSLQNCERECEERFRIQLEQHQEKLNRKERELQDVFLKIGCSGVSLEMTEHMWQKDVNHHLQKNSSRTLEKVTNFSFGDLEEQPVAQGDESEQVISVIQALENKLCDTEERLQEINVHLQQQQQKFADEIEDQWNIPNESLRPGAREHCGTVLEKTASNAKVKSATNKMLNFDLQEALQEEDTSPEKLLSQWMTSRMLYLEALVIQKIASALEHPSKHLLEGLSEMHSQTMALRESYNGRHEGPVTRNYSQLFSYYQELGEVGCSLDEHEISNMCMKAELAYLTYTNHLHNPVEKHGSQAFNIPFYLGSEVTPLDTKEGTSSITGLSDFRLPELVPCTKRKQGEGMGYIPGDMDKDSLVMELWAQAHSLKAISKQLHPLDENAGVPSELSPVLLRTVLFQAILAYVTSRLHVALQRQMHLLQDQQVPAECQCHRLEAVLQEQAEIYEEKLREDRVVIEVAKLARISAETDAQIKGQEVQQMKVELQKKLQELQQIHEEEINSLHEYYTQSQSQTTSPTESSNEDGKLSVTTMKDRINELELQIRCLEDEIHRGDPNTLRKAYEKELETLKVTCELGFSSMEQSHQRVIEEMQRQHQIEVEQLLEEKERVLQEETNATIAAIEAMRKAHKEELEKSKKAQQNGVSTDVNKLRAQFKDELDSLHRELEVLSEQYSQKCLENAHLTRAIETERQALSSVERDNQELLTRNQELNKHLVAELSLMHSPMNGGMDKAELSQGKDVIQLEVALRVKESEIQCLKQEISSLKEELQATNRHCKKLLNELSVSGVKCETTRVKHSAETFRQRSQSYDLMKSKSNPDFLKNRTKPNQPTRSKSLREHLSVQERVKLFE